MNKQFTHSALSLSLSVLMFVSGSVSANFSSPFSDPEERPLLFSDGELAEMPKPAQKVQNVTFNAAPKPQQVEPKPQQVQKNVMPAVSEKPRELEVGFSTSDMESSKAQLEKIRRDAEDAKKVAIAKENEAKRIESELAKKMEQQRLEEARIRAERERQEKAHQERIRIEELNKARLEKERIEREFQEKKAKEQEEARLKEMAERELRRKLAEQRLAEMQAEAEAKLRAEQEARDRANAEKEARKKLEAERLAKEAAEKAEAARLAREAKIEADRLAKEAAAKAEAERLAKAEAARLAKEAAAKAEAERLAKVEADRLVKEAAAKAEADRLVKEAAAKAEADRLVKEAAAKATAARLAKEATAKAAADRAAQEASEADRLAREALTSKVKVSGLSAATQFGAVPTSPVVSGTYAGPTYANRATQSALQKATSKIAVDPAKMPLRNRVLGFTATKDQIESLNARYQYDPSRMSIMPKQVGDIKLLPVARLTGDTIAIFSTASDKQIVEEYLSYHPLHSQVFSNFVKRVMTMNGGQTGGLSVDKALMEELTYNFATTPIKSTTLKNAQDEYLYITSRLNDADQIKFWNWVNTVKTGEEINVPTWIGLADVMYSQ